MLKIDRTGLSHERQAVGLHVMVIDDEASIRGPVGLCLETLGHRVVEVGTAEDAVAAAGRSAFDVAILDVRLGTADGLQAMTQLLAIQPRMKIVIITAYASVDVAIRAMARGAVDFLCKPFTPDQLTAAVTRAGGLCALESSVGLSPDRLGTAGAEADFATTCAPLQEAVSTARRAAPSQTPMLIAGEAGTGKSVLARAIHGWSSRAEKPFMWLDCASRSAAYVELAVFGHAVVADQQVIAEQPPMVRQCNGGTLLITRVEALGRVTQQRISRLIDTGEYEPADAGQAVKCDLRVIATTDASAAIPEPLGPSLERVRITLPALRERVDDIPMLAQRYLAYVRQSSHKVVLGFKSDALEVMGGYGWPGNLRELRAVVADSVAAADTLYVEARHLPAALRTASAGGRRDLRAGDRVTLENLEAAHISAVLSSAGTLQEAAEILGIDQQALYRRRKQFGLA